jgi:hypothetical protein
MTNPDVYPVTAAFEKEFEEKLEALRLTGNLQYNHAYPVFRTMAENIGEYEHGSADVQDCIGNWTDDNKAAVQIYADVCRDVLTSFISTAIERR